jgi:hypothetical protein
MYLGQISGGLTRTWSPRHVHGILVSTDINYGYEELVAMHFEKLVRDECDPECYEKSDELGQNIVQEVVRRV